MKWKIKITDIDRSGIYKITNTITNDCYIGSSVNLKRRIYRHRSELKNKVHSNIILQRAVDKYEIDNFIVECLEFCEKEDLLIREQYFVDTLHPKYNIRKECVYNNLGVKISEETKEKISKANSGKVRSEECKTILRELNLGKKASEETRQKMSMSQKNKSKTEEHKRKISESNKGKTMSKESIEKGIKTKKDRGVMLGEKNPKAKLTQKDVNLIREKLLTIKISEIAKEYGVSYQTIHSIKNNKTWVI